MKPQPKNGKFGRRQFLLGTAALLAGAQVLTGMQPAFARSTLQPGLLPKFMQASGLLINHQLSPGVGGRIAEFADVQYPDLEVMLDQIIATAAARDTAVVEEFFPDLAEGPLRDFAYWVIQSWYTGSSSDARDGTLFTYEEALLYQPTIDMVPIPTFGFSGPNAWGNDLFPLDQIPRF